MTRFDVIQISADRGIAPGSTKGAAQHLRGTAAGLRHRGHRVTTYSARRAEGRFPAPVSPLEALGQIGLDHTPNDHQPIVYERYSLGHLGGLELSRRLGVPFVLEVNAPLVAEASLHRPGTVDSAHATAEAELVAAADLVVVVSGALQDWAKVRRSGPTVVIRNGFESAWFAEPASPESPEYPLAFIGHPKPWHGADRLIYLLVALAKIGRRPDLLVIGGGPGADALRTAALGAGVGTQLEITGALPPARASSMLASCGIGLAPYRRQDSFYFCPLKVIDYLAAGLPVVATNQGDIARLVDDAGLVVDPDEDDQFVAAVAGLLDNAPARRAMGISGRARAMRSMTWDHVAGRTEAAMVSILAGARVGA